jgi:hypothetical protein
MIASNSRWLVAAPALLVPAMALADPPAAPPTEAQVEAARPLYHEARELHRAGKLSEALDKALEAYRIAATPVTAVEAGELLVELGRFVEARDIVRGVAALPASPRESDKGKDARQQAAALAASLDGRIPKIALAARPPEVAVVLDGKPLSSVDATAWQGVDPGAHALAVLVDGKPCTTIHVALAEGEERTIDLHDAASACRKEPVPAPTPLAAPPAAAPPAPASAPVSPPPPPESPPVASSAANPMRWIGLAIAGAGVVTVGVGGGLALGAKSQYDSVANECSAQGCSRDGYDVRNGARSRADVATIVMGVGAAAVAGGVLLWLFEPSRVTSVGMGAGTVALRTAW